METHLNTILHRFKKPLIWCGAVLAALVLLGFFAVPPLAKAVLMKRLSATLHREVTIQQVRFNPFTLSLTLKGFLVKDRDSRERFVSFDELYLNLESFSVLRRALILKEVRLSQPFIRIVRHQDNTYNLSDLLSAKDQPRKGDAGPPVLFSLNNIRIIDGSVDFWDEPKQKKHAVRDANISVPFISTIPSHIETFVHPAFSAKINDAQYALKGDTKPFAGSQETTFDINIDNLDIPYYLAYVPFETDFKILSAYLDAKVQFSFIQHPDGQRALTLKGDLALKQTSVNDGHNDPFLRLPFLGVSMASTEPLARRVHLSRVLFHSPELHIRRDSAGAFNFDSFLPQRQEARIGPETSAARAPGPVADPDTAAQNSPPREGSASPLSLEIDEAQMVKGKLSFSDLSRATPFNTVLHPVELKVSNFSNGKDKQSRFTLLIRSEADETITLEGDLSVDPVAAKGRVDIKSVPIRKYAPYYANMILFDVKNGLLDLSSDYTYTGPPTNSGVTFSNLSALVNSLRLKKRDEPEDFLSTPIFAVKNSRVDQTKRELHIGEVVTEKGSIVVRRLKDAKVNIQTLLVPSSDSGAQTIRARLAEAEQPWLVSLGKFSADKYTMVAEDQVPAEPVILKAQALRLRAENLSTKEGQRGNVLLSFDLHEKGSALIKGSVSVNPLSAGLFLDLKDMDFRLAQPYFADRVKIIVTNGSVTTSGNLSVIDQKGTGLKASYKGDTTLSRFSSIDKAHAEDFLTWESLDLSDLDVGYSPTYVHVNTVALTDFYARIILHPDGSLNLQHLVEAKSGEAEPSRTVQSPTAGTAAATPDKTLGDTRIQRVTLQGGRINFSDRSVKPNYSLNLKEMGGRISGLSSEETSLADVELRGKLGQYTPIEILGKINPLRKDLFVDLKVKTKDVELSPMTPYSGKYIGYTIQKGKLSFDLTYLIDKRKLDSQHTVFLDQLTLGDQVDSPHATRLPVRLAIALLKDRNGEIHLELPVTGSLDDPKFGVWGIIVQILVNLLTKAATSPFALLGAAFGGGGEDLGYLEFDYGSVAIADSNLKKLDTLIKALYDRPSLKLEIEGHADVDEDKEAVKQYQFRKKLKVQKLQDRVKQGLPPVPVDDLKVERNEYDKFLTAAYKAEKFPKPRNFLGFAKSLPVPEMEKLMLTNIQVKDDDLRSLASQRAMNVKDTILKSGKIEPSRVFVVEPKSLSPERREKVRDSRVEFKIR
jgi:uncharacterized protein involved in outer membrane biogenesis